MAGAVHGLGGFRYPSRMAQTNSSILWMRDKHAKGGSKVRSKTIRQGGRKLKGSQKWDRRGNEVGTESGNKGKYSLCNLCVRLPATSHFLLPPALFLLCINFRALKEGEINNHHRGSRAEHSPRYRSYVVSTKVQRRTEIPATKKSQKGLSAPASSA